MNTAEVRMTFDEWGEVLRIAATIWPQSRSFFEDAPDAERTPTRTWWAALSRFDTDDVLAAIGRLGITSRYWPCLAEVVEVTREVLASRLEQLRRSEQHCRARLATPGQGTVEERLKVFDRMTAAARVQHRAEVEDFVARSGGGGSGLRDPATSPGEIGVWERHVRDLVAHGWPCEDEFAAGRLTAELPPRTSPGVVGILTVPRVAARCIRSRARPPCSH